MGESMGSDADGTSHDGLAELEWQPQCARAQQQFRQAEAQPQLVRQQVESQLCLCWRPKIALFSPASGGSFFLNAPHPSSQHFPYFI